MKSVNNKFLMSSSLDIQLSIHIHSINDHNVLKNTGLTAILGPFCSSGFNFNMGSPVDSSDPGERNGPRIAVNPVVSKEHSIKIQ